MFPLRVCIAILVHEYEDLDCCERPSIARPWLRAEVNTERGQLSYLRAVEKDKASLNEYNMQIDTRRLLYVYETHELHVPQILFTVYRS